MSQATVATRPIARWLTDVLGGDALLQTLAPGGVWEDQLPQPVAGSAQTYPAIVFHLQAPARDVRPSGYQYTMSDALYTVRGIDKRAEYDRLEGVAQQIALLLDNKDGTPAGGQVFACQRESQIQYPETAEGGTQFRHLGGVWRVLAV